MQTALHYETLPDGDAPDWVHLVPGGTFSGADGRGPYHLKDPAGVIARSMADGPLALDENHATDHAMNSGIASPARGWITDMQARDDGLWGHVDWTPGGKQLVAEKAYRGFSPTFEHDGKGTVHRVLRAALTNTPNLKQLKTLHTQQETDMDPAQLRAALGLPETADETAILAAVTANATAATTHAQQMTAIATAAGLDAQLAPDGIVTALQAQRASASDADTLAGKVVTLQTELTTLRQGMARDRAAAFVDGAIAAGKPINPLRDRYIQRHMQDPQGVEMEVAALPSINAGGIALNAAQGGDGDGLTAEDHAVAKRMGIDVKALAKFRKERSGREGSAA